MKSNGGKRRWLVSLLFVAVVGCVLGWSIINQPQPLLSRAIPRFETKSVDTKPEELVPWRSETQCLVMSSPIVNDKIRWSIEMMDSRTGSREHLTKLEQLFDESKASFCTASPDGQWIHWSGRDNKEHIARMDASHHYAWPQLTGTAWGGRWSTNSSAWMRIHSSDGGAAVNNSLPMDGYLIVDPSQQRGGDLLKFHHLSPVLASFSALSEYTALPGPVIRTWGIPAGTGLSQTGLAIYELDPDHGLSQLHQYTISIPQKAECYECVFTPDGSRIAIVTSEEVRPYWRSLLGSINRRWQGGTSTQISLWVSRFDGTDLRKIGYLSNSSANSTVSVIRWNQDGHSVRFDCGGKWYSVEVGR